KMMATLGVDKIDRLVEILQEKFNDSVSLAASQFELIKTEIPKKQLQAKRKLFVPPKNPPVQTQTGDLELEAMALELELELLNFAA
ncbi:MAG: hypothetical protein ACOYXT_06485, partial [Bacteroidota bacterium]